MDRMSLALEEERLKKLKSQDSNKIQEDKVFFFFYLFINLFLYFKETLYSLPSSLQFSYS
jgi:hypothetical protein